MPGYTRQMLSNINSQVDMYNQFKLLMNQVYDCLLLFQPNVYIISSPDPPDVPSKIRVQIIWESKTCNKHVSFSRALIANENYKHVLVEIKAICTYAFPYYDLIYGVNCLDEI